MVNIVVIGARPDWQEMVQAPWELIAAVRINGLEQPADNPNVHGQNVQIPGKGTPENGATNGTES